MMKNIINYLPFVFICLFMNSCKKSAFLDQKPSTDIIQPKTLIDFQKILDNTTVMNYTGALGQISGDDFQVSYVDYLTASETERNAYIWLKDIYGGDLAVQDWNGLYKEVFYANVVLEGIENPESLKTAIGQNLKGWALFSRAFAFYDLTKNFCKAYDINSENTDLGIPLRLSSSIDYTLQRSTLKNSFDQILSDLNNSIPLLPSTRPSGNLNRPSQLAAYALLSRIYLDMRNYTEAEKYSDLCLNIYSSLIDYNTISKTSSTPFSTTNNELIISKIQVPVYPIMTNTASGVTAKISSELIAQYSPSDLRLKVYFFLAPDGTYTKKRGYSGLGAYPSTGLATDEIYLIKAECLARRGEINASMDKLNQLLVKRYDNTIPYIALTAISQAEALYNVITERRKELVFRGLRWHDIKRLNKEGFNITLRRTLNDQIFTLPPNDPRYVFPIPNDEVALSGIQQNMR